MKNQYLSLFLFSITLFFFSCSSDVQQGKATNVKFVEKSAELAPITGIALGISADVYVKQGNKQSVRFEGDDEFISKISRKVKNGTWQIEMKDKWNNYKKNYGKTKIYVTMKEIQELSVGGSGDIIGENHFDRANQVELSIGGSGSIEVDVQAKSVEASIGGSGDIDISGQSPDLDLSIAGSGDIDAAGLQSSDCDVSIAGSGSCKVDVSSNLDVSIVGSGDVFYKGNPQVSVSKVGSGSVKPL